MATFYVEVYRPAYPERGVHVRVYSERQYCIDSLSPSLTGLWRVEQCRSKADAIPLVLEKAAGKAVAVTRVA